MKAKNSWYVDKKTAVIYVVLRILVIAVMILQFFHGNYNNVFLCILTLILFMIPTVVDTKLNIKLPSALEIIILLFIFAAEILGEIQSFYTFIPNWDTMLHTINGFLMAAIGFSMIDILNRSPRFHISMSPMFVAFVAFCFSMTVGVIWEFFEYSMDSIFLTDMQKDWLVSAVSSVKLNEEGINTPVIIKNITETVINGTVNGEPVSFKVEGGYLDIGIIDTMKDLIVNCIGAVAFSVLGVFYLKNREKGSVAEKFIPQMKTEEEIIHTKEMINELKKRRRHRKNKKH